MNGYDEQYINMNAQPKRKVKTNKDRTRGEIFKLIHARKNYTRYKTIADKLMALGLPKQNVHAALLLTHELIDKGIKYKYRTVSHAAKDSIDFIAFELGEAEYNFSK
jgi:hypothetical protein